MWKLFFHDCQSLYNVSLFIAVEDLTRVNISLHLTRLNNKPIICRISFTNLSGNPSPIIPNHIQYKAIMVAILSLITPNTHSVLVYTTAVSDRICVLLINDHHQGQEYHFNMTDHFGFYHNQLKKKRNLLKTAYNHNWKDVDVLYWNRANNC